LIALGEIRDLSPITTALRAADAGHMLIVTLHTTDAVHTINRVIDAIPVSQQHQIKQQLAKPIKAVLSQTLLNRISDGRLGAFSILLANDAVRNVICFRTNQANSRVRPFPAEWLSRAYVRELFGQKALDVAAALQAQGSLFFKFIILSLKHSVLLFPLRLFLLTG
jgi:Tfp pilus assembly pilus retraction ATPase PilT